MARVEPFERHSDAYEAWFQRFPKVYESEIDAIRAALPEGRGVEIGVGSGLFASPLGIAEGVEPSAAMAGLARERGIHVSRGVAEDLPYHDHHFDFALMVTTICFVDDPVRALAEISRIVKPGGAVILAFVDRDSALGGIYEEIREGNLFYRDATFYSVAQIEDYLNNGGFIVETISQTVFGDLGTIHEVQPAKSGHGEGGFVVLRARTRG